MDALALLCTLHADGPATLKRLRAAGCISLERVLGIETDDLARILGTTHAGAERFAREAKILRHRAEFLGREEDLSHVNGAGDDDGSHAASEDGAHPARGSQARENGAHLADGGDVDDAADDVVVNDGTTIDSVDGDGFARSLASRERREFERVLETWRERDLQDGPAEISDGDVESDVTDADDELTSRDDERATEAAFACRPGALDGLDEGLCRVLANVGIDDLHELSAIDAVDLSRRTGLAFSKLLRLRYLAAKRLAGEADTSASVRVAQPIERSGSSAPRAPIKFSVSERPYEVRAQALDLDRDLLAAPRAALPLHGSSRPDAAITEARVRDSGRMDRAGGPFA